jgi:hypothetical protein
MKIYHYDSMSKIFIGTGFADESPLEPDVWLLPAHSTEFEPIETQDGKIQAFIDNKWVLIDIPVSDEVEQNTQEVPFLEIKK